MDWKTVERTAAEAVESMRAMQYEPSRGFKSLWPAMWCEWASIAVAEALKQRGLGEWTYVQASRPGEPSGHAWLELRDDHGAVLYSIDVTLHQFPGHDAPYIGVGRSPAAAQFTEVHFEGPWEGWPVIQRNATYAEFAKATLQHMSRGARKALADLPPGARSNPER